MDSTRCRGRLELLERAPISEDERRAPGLRHVAFAVADIDAAYADLSNQGTAFLEPPVGGADGRPRACFFRAPDATFIELIQPLAGGEWPFAMASAAGTAPRFDASLKRRSVLSLPRRGRSWPVVSAPASRG